MTFLQPFILWGLPLILLPVVIHLLNRLRHRPLPWAAMMFLRTATRKSTRYARLRQLLILLFRVLAVLALVLALSRPLAGGWMGWLAGTAPDTIVVVLDRSASMESATVGGQSTKRAQAVELFAQSAAALTQSSRLVLLENAHLDPQEITPVEALLTHPRTGPTDTAADLPVLMDAALDWIIQNKPGTVEIWIASDMQESNWRPESERWPMIVEGLKELPQGVRVRLLGLNHEHEGNVSVATRTANRRDLGGEDSLDLLLEIERRESHAATLPVTLQVNGVASQIDVPLDGTSVRYRHRIPLSGEVQGGWGRVSLPADSNRSDNDSYFVFGPAPRLRAAVAATDSFVSKVLALAAAPNPANTNQSCEVIPSSQWELVNWGDYALVMWQGALPEGETADRLRAYVEQGGVLLMFPGGDPQRWDQSGWAELQETEAATPFAIGDWDEQGGPLASTEEGLSLPLHELDVIRRQAVVGEGRVLSRFDDELAFLSRRAVGRGQIYFCATLPHPKWSRLFDGQVLVPLVQRLLEDGGERLSLARQAACGDVVPPADSGLWVGVEPAGIGQPELRAGVFQAGNQWLAVHRPAVEDSRDLLDADQARALFGTVSFQMFEEQKSGTARLQSELWRLFLLAMLIFLVGEAILIIPERRMTVPVTSGRGGVTGAGLPASPDAGRGVETEVASR